jgi:hypothetical protein|nr:MAG TPA: hypothetical protein [Caudoviricetes sp.]
MNTQEKVINNLGIQLANKTISEAFSLAERDEAQEQLRNVQTELDKIHNIIQSDEQLKALFEEAKNKLEQ